FETDDADLAKSVITEQTNELTNTSKETELNTVSLNLREASWVWEHFSKEYNTKNELKSFICTICRLKYKPTNTPRTLAKHLYNKYNNLVEIQQSLVILYNQENVAELKPDLDVETRWNSTYMMLKNFLQMRDILDIFVVKNRDLSSLYLQDDDWLV
ncbi:15091_t:CDS:2, partial [Racocetra persica]